MGSAATIALAFSMSMDAFAAALGKGVGLHRPRLVEALRTGVIFGVVETVTPVLGWMVGLSAAPGLPGSIIGWPLSCSQSSAAEWFYRRFVRRKGSRHRPGTRWAC